LPATPRNKTIAHAGALMLGRSDDVMRFRPEPDTRPASSRPQRRQHDGRHTRVPLGQAPEAGGARRD
jgi:hypothetical protein